MAQPAVPNLFQQVAANNEATQQRGAATVRCFGLPISLQAQGELNDVELTQPSLTSMLVTDINGRAILPTQAVIVEYLTETQKLQIPAALGMSMVPGALGRIPNVPALLERYHKLSTLSYPQLRAFIENSNTVQEIRAVIDAIVLPPPLQQIRKTDWNDDTWCVLAEGVVDSQVNIAITFARVSSACQFNCDIRDVAKLNDANMMVGDGAWIAASTITADRLDSKLKAYTLQTTAALNYQACASYSPAAWVRAHCLSAGILPSPASTARNETVYVLGLPPAESRASVANWEIEQNISLRPLCLNVAAMFGLLHLNKDHTYRTGDANMERIGTAYINALRTITTPAMVEQFQNHKEAMLRTAAHPFGLAQTYWLAQVMGSLGFLASPLAIRADSTPPPVQRLMIVDAATKEWSSLPAGRVINDIYTNQLTQIVGAVSQIKQSPPAYSGLHVLYGVTVQAVVEAVVTEAAMMLMPPIYGYAMSQHQNDAGEKDGIALALSLNNIARDQRALVNTWQTLWDKYVADVDQMGLIQFAMQAAELAGQQMPAMLGGSGVGAAGVAPPQT